MSTGAAVRGGSPTAGDGSTVVHMTVSSSPTAGAASVAASPEPSESPADLPPTVFLMYGASGDLGRRLVLPAFFQLALQGLLPERWTLIGSGRGDAGDSADDAFRAHVHDALVEFGPHPDEGPWDEFSAHLRFAGGGFTADDAGEVLAVLAAAREDLGDDAQLVHYLAIPPRAFLPTTRAIAEHGLVDGCRIVYEKPYGTSLTTFTELDDAVQQVFTEDQVYRIDHFLAFEAVQDVLHARLANPWLAALWSREYVAQVQIDIAETLDVAQRAEFYDATGAFLDMIVTHLFQIAATVAMEAPADLRPETVQTARDAAVLRFRPLDPADVVLGRFDGYLDIDGIPADSTTDTLAAVRLWIDDDRWRDVPFLLRSGKKMAADEQRITLVLRPAADGPYAHAAPPEPAVISFSLLGGAALDIAVTVRAPGVQAGPVTGTATLHRTDLPGDPALPYTHLIHHVLHADRSLFTGVDGLRAAWEAVEPIAQDRPQVQDYAPGSWGPADVDRLAEPGVWFLR